MYKYTQVLFLLAYSQGVFTWNIDKSKIPNSISRDSYSFEEPQLNDDDGSDLQSWVYKNHEKTQFNYEPHSNYDDRIFFPDDYGDIKEHKPKNSESNLERFIQKCKRLCPTKNEYNPVCGTDNVTYYNLDLLKCVRDCGENVALKYTSACNNQGSTTSQPVKPSTVRDIIQSCMSVCPTTSEYNPVCGTDNVTYNNIGKLTCAQVCGVEVQLKIRLPCPKTRPHEDSPFTTEAPTTTTLDSRYFRLCMDSCITTSEYNPVCASNGKTYYNMGKYQCAKSCGLDISIRIKGSCLRLAESDKVPSATTLSSTSTTEIVIDKDLLEKVFHHEDPGDSLIDVRIA